MLKWKKNKRFFIILGISFMLIDLAIFWGVQMYYAKPQGIRNQSPNIRISLEEFVKAFDADAKSAHTRFQQKIIELQGRFSEVKQDSQFVHLNYKGSNYDINISLDTTEKQTPLAGHSLKVKARYVGYEAADPEMMLPGIIRLKDGVIVEPND